MIAELELVEGGLSRFHYQILLLGDFKGYSLEEGVGLFSVSSEGRN